MEILILVTGGTFDKEYNELTGELFFKDTHVKEMLSLGRNLVSTTTETLMMKDSLYMTDDDRRFIAEYCKKVRQSHIIITHGPNHGGNCEYTCPKKFKKNNCPYRCR
jgi:L-asparaginase